MKEVSLKEYIQEISMGPFGSNIKVDNFISSGVPVLNGSNLTNHKLVEDGFKYVSEKKANSLGKANAKRGDIVITHRGTLGQVAYIPFDSKFERYVISQSQFRVRFKDSINPIYFAYLMLSKYGQKKLLSFKNHVGVPALAQATTNFKLLKLFIPNILTQNKIASVLSALDDKIELNNKINAELETMVKTIYDCWFVQFDFPNADGKPYKSSGGEMVYDVVLKREIPKEWEVKSLGEIANINMGQSPEGTSYNDEGEGMIFYQGSTDFGWRFPTVRQFTKKPTRFAKTGDILLSVRAPVGTFNVAKEDCCIGRGLSALHSKDNFNSFLLYQMSYFKKKFDNINSVGTTFGSITKDGLHSLMLCYPGINVLRQFEEIVSAFDSKIFINSQQNQELASLRDWLLPMLMNGQVTVAGA
ncbi:MAG: restriction endonuclease subunit S [Candidatus Saccharimonadaceae bacterium]